MFNSKINKLNNEIYNEVKYEEDEDDDDDAKEEYNERIGYNYYNIEENNENKNEYFNNIDITKYLTEKEVLNIINNNNLWKIDHQKRWEILKYMKYKYLENSDLSDFNIKDSLLKKYNDNIEELKKFELENDSKIIKQNKIIAMTTTGCAKYSTILEKNNFEIVIIEEAAEVLESHIISLLTKNTKHLIMIGDHLQLRPNPYNYELIIEYNFDISLFERLINNKIKYAHLKFQRRMKSIFADFVRLIYGEEEYIDYEDIKSKDNIEVKGMKNDMFIITHNQPEKKVDKILSKSNPYEAEYIVKLYKYLIQQGYLNSQITVLTFYLGQLFLLKQQFKKEEIFNVKISTVDNYQGEENDIILLSLVRSNNENKIGFLNNFNRVCVSFSRAKIGFYIIGNINCLTEGEKNAKNKRMRNIWSKIKKLAIKKNIISNELQLICQKHKNTTIIKDINDFKKVRYGGCDRKIQCEEVLLCGHKCYMNCHPFPHYLANECPILCNIKLPCGHICKGTCGTCLNKTLHIPCKYELCGKKLICGHICKEKCSDNCICKEKCPIKCYHSSNYNKNIISYNNFKYCLKECCKDCDECYENCELGCKDKKCNKKCYEICGIDRCNFKCEKKLKKCKHNCMGLCSQKCPYICIKCNPKNQIFKDMKINQLFYQTECGCYFKIEEIDNYIDQNKKIELPICNKCNKILTYEPRYQDIIKSKLKDIQEIKTIILDKNYFKDNQNIIQDIKDKIDNNYIDILPNFQSNFNRNKSEDNLKDILNESNLFYLGFKNNMIDLRTNEIFCQIPYFIPIEYYQKKLIKKNLSDLAKIEEIYLWNYECLKKYFLRFNNFNKDFYENLKKKIMNLLCYYIIFGENIISHRDLESFKIKMELMDESNNIEIIKNKMLNNNFNCDINDLQIFLQKENIKNNIFLSSLSSTWYKCPNNHYYVNEDGDDKNCIYCISKQNFKEKLYKKIIYNSSDDNSYSDNNSDNDNNNNDNSSYNEENENDNINDNENEDSEEYFM